MRLLVLTIFVSSAVSAQERTESETRAATTPAHCEALAQALQTIVTRCNFSPWGGANVTAENLGTIDYLSTVTESEDENGQTVFDRNLLARKVEEFLDTLRPLTKLRETPSLVIERVDFRERNGSIKVNQFIHGLKVRSRPTISLDTVSGRVYRMNGFYWSSGDVSPPSPEWVREDDAVALAVDGVATKYGKVGQYELREARLEWEWDAEGLRPQWRLNFQVAGFGYLAFVNALTGETAVGDGSIH